MIRLSDASVSRLPPDIERPEYPRAGVAAGVVHLGIGAFHRAHQAVAFDDLIRRGDRRWGVRGASLRSPGVRNDLQPQDGLYSLAVSDAESTRVRVIGALQQVLVAPEDPTALVEALASPQTHIATLTVTEKGYKLDPASGDLLEDDPALACDLATLARPRTAPGFLAAGLALRRERGLPALTVISCDNLPGNGARLRAAVLALARRQDPGLADWIAERAAFPQTMVDRIVPATTEEDIAGMSRRLGVLDRATVRTEAFSQWILEDRFAGEHPDFAAVGVQLTTSVAPWEDAKLRLLNGAHSAIAYLGGLAGIEFVHQFVEDDVRRRFVGHLWDEAQATLSPPPGLDLAAYRAALLARFANPALQHRTWQIAVDGSQKLPQRLVASAAARLDRGLAVEALALAIAAWMRWQEGRDGQGEPYLLDDPLASTTRRLVEGAASPADKVAALLGLGAVFPAPLAANPAFRAALTRQAERLWRRGPLEAIAAFAAEAGRPPA